MILRIVEPISFQLSKGDYLEIPVGAYTVINFYYISHLIDDIITNFYMVDEEFKELVEKHQLFIIYHKRHFIAIRKDMCEIPKIYNGWFNY